MSHHLTKEGDFLSDKYRILRLDSLEGMKLEFSPDYEYSSAGMTRKNHREGYNQALEDIKKLSEDVSLNKIVVSFKAPQAHKALEELAEGYDKTDPELSDDIREVLNKYKE